MQFGENMTRTTIYKQSAHGEVELGYVDEDGLIYKLRWGEGKPVGRVDTDGQIFRKTQFDERELGHVTSDGEIYSNGLFEGGALGWLDEDGIVIQGGLIFSEEEVGRVAGPQQRSAAGALLLLFLPDDAEADRRDAR